MLGSRERRKEGARMFRAALLCWLGLLAGLPVADAREPGSDEDRLAERTWQGVPYRSGGVGADERAKLEAFSGAYNLKLVFASRESLAYLADVEVAIDSASGQRILEAISRGPWFFTRLPPGRYRIRATQGGTPQERTVELGEGRPREVYFYW
jgi:hypothetical protein